MKWSRLITGFGASLLLSLHVHAQDAMVTSTLPYSTDVKNAAADTTNTDYLIKEILIVGNKRTRRSTIMRELSFQPAENYPLPTIIKKLEEAKNQLTNTGLFRKVVVYLRSLQDHSVFINVEVTEKWYFFPQPFIRVATGTFSQWNERGRRLDQLNYGLKLTQYNFSGRGDKMHLNVSSGYTKKVALQYQGFYFDKALKWSGNISIAHGKNRELNYATERNKLLSLKTPDQFLLEFSQLAFDVTYRPAIKTRHTFSIGYNHNQIADTVNKLNAYFSPTQNIYSYPYISYGISFSDLDFNAYPTRGKSGDASIQKAGINGGFNLWQFSARGSSFWSLGSNSYFNLKAGGVIKLPFKQPYVTQQFLGYGDAYLQGYENYIVDGVAGGYAKATIGLKILTKDIPLPQIKWLKAWPAIPVKLYIKTFANVGYAHNPNVTLPNGLNNRMLYSSGVGLDIVAFTDLVFKIEWSFNQLGQNALYLHQ